ncbi:hypothetical protein ACIHQR_24995 [Corallococcus coralloides]|uniref:hypothetical protein n=1 Tax=Corallococcus coralloides TaxID=184914 RepID=UPI00384BF2E2
MLVDKRPRRANQRRRLEQAGYQVLPIEKLDNGGWLSKPLARAGNSALSGNWDDVKYFSDLERLLYLDFVGGIHLDVDIALCDIDLQDTIEAFRKAIDKYDGILGGMSLSRPLLFGRAKGAIWTRL